jgi:hypothetical protein
MTVTRNDIAHSLYIMLVSILYSCGGGEDSKSLKQKSENGSDNFDYALRSVIFNPANEQNYLEFLSTANLTLSDNVSAEYRTLYGLAHVYQGELYEVTSQILSQMQLDLYEGSNDLAHGEKFPINYQNLGHQDEMHIWRGIDAGESYGAETERSILSRIQNKNYSNIVSTLTHFYQHKSKQSIHDNTLIDLNSDRDHLINQSIIPSLSSQLELEDMYLDGKFSELLSRIEPIIGKEIFPDEMQFIYFNSMMFKLAALCHYELGVINLEKGFEESSSLPDSTIFQLISIMNLAHLFDRFEKSEKISELWKKNRNMMVANSQSLLLITQTHPRKPYNTDWMYFVNSLIENIPDFTLPSELAHLDYRRDNLSEGIMDFLTREDDLEVEIKIIDIIDQLMNNPSLIDKYPTLMSIFVQELNLSSLSVEYKAQIQDLTELLVFNVAHSSKSWQRNRPSFLIALYGSLRWHGSRLPNCNGFVQDLVKRYPPLVSLAGISNLFTQQMLNTKSNPKPLKKINSSIP